MYCFKNLHIHAHTPILYFSLSYPTCLTFSGGRGEGGDSGGDDNGDLGEGDDWDGGLCIQIQIQNFHNQTIRGYQFLDAS